MATATVGTLYKPGDHVRLLNKRGGKPEVGDIGVVKAWGGQNGNICFPNQYGYIVREEDVTKVDSPKVGDTVRCFDAKIETSEGLDGGGGWEDGKEFEVTKISTGHRGDNILWHDEESGVYATWTVPVNPTKGEVTEEKVKREIKPIKSIKLGKHDILGQNKIHKQLELAVELNMPVLIVGETGTGKTTIVKSVADKIGADWIRFNLTGETTVDEFVGKYVLQNQQTIWEDGVLLTAMKQGKWLIVDEVNVALPEILFVLHSLLDDDRSVMVANHQGEVVKPHEDFRFFGTMNPVDEYAGTKDLNKAFKSRFGMILNMAYPSSRLETQIVHAKGNIDLPTAMQIVDVGKQIRKAKDQSEVFYTCSTRDLIQWGSLVSALGMQDAFEVAILNKANGDREIVKRLYAGVCDGYKQAKSDGLKLNLQELVEINAQIEKDMASLDKYRKDVESKVKKDLLKQLVGKGTDSDLKQLIKEL